MTPRLLVLIVTAPAVSLLASSACLGRGSRRTPVPTNQTPDESLDKATLLSRSPTHIAAPPSQGLDTGVPPMCAVTTLLGIVDKNLDT